MSANKEGNYYASEIVHLSEEMDPVVKAELEILNQSAMCLNRLEKELDEAKAKYQSTFDEFSQRLELLKKNIGSSIKRARPYYELKEVAKKKQGEALKSARRFQTSNSFYIAAKETVSQAELRLNDDRAACSSVTWQEKFNEALLRVVETEKEKSVSEQEHLRCATAFADVDNKLHVLEKQYKRSITKARLYFETKKVLEVKLQQVKQAVEDIQQAIQGTKQQYSSALKYLEKISDSIHEKRCQEVVLMFPREPGVGAEDCQLISEFETQCPTLSAVNDVHTLDDLCDEDDDSNENYNDCELKNMSNEQHPDNIFDDNNDTCMT